MDNDDNRKSNKIEYYYFKDHQGRLKRLRKPDYKPRQGYYRIKFLQKYYIWWLRKSFDFKNAIVPLIIGFSFSFIIYEFSMLWSQNDLQRQIKARLPFQFSYEKIKKAQKGQFC